MMARAGKRDTAIVAALKALAETGNIEAEAASILNGGGDDAEIAARCVARAKAGQVVALTALADAGALERLA